MKYWQNWFVTAERITCVKPDSIFTRVQNTHITKDWRKNSEKYENYIHYHFFPTIWKGLTFFLLVQWVEHNCSFEEELERSPEIENLFNDIVHKTNFPTLLVFHENIREFEK